MNKRAFTLAEILITLGIIGIVAAVTIPTLVANHRNKALSAQLKKSVSTLTNGYKLMMADEGVDRISLTKFNSLLSESDETNLDTYLKKYFNIIETEKLNASGCMNYTCTSLQGGWNMETSGENAEHLMTQPQYWSCTCNQPASKRKYNMFENHHNTYDLPGCMLLKQSDGSELCISGPGQVFIDVNGYGKTPNTVGADFFEIRLSDTGNVLPFYDAHSPVTNYFAETMRNNWEIKYY